MQRRAFLATGLGSLLRAQNAPAPAFEVASIRKNTHGAPAPRGNGDGPLPPPPPPVLRPTPGGLTLENATLKYCLMWAYSLRSKQVEGPWWINDQHYDIHARTGAPAETPEVKRMLQTLLTARFHLEMRRQTREMPVLGIVAARGGSKLIASKPDTPAERKVTSLPGGVLRIEAKNTGLNIMEDLLTFPVWDPVVNLSGMNGGFDFTFERPPFRGRPDEILSEYNVALQRQLGLRLEPRKAPLEMIEVVSGNPNPIEN